MIVPGSANPLLLGQTSGYNLTNSLRFRSSASAYLSRTLGTPTDSDVWTFSFWIKRGSLGSVQEIITSSNGSSNQCSIQFNSSDQLRILNYIGGAFKTQYVTTQVFRDPSSWYHIVVRQNSSSGFFLYVNGTQVTSFGTATGPDASDWLINQSGRTVNIGREQLGGVNYFDGYLTEVNFIDGQALTPSSFGQTSSTTGVWQPKKYSGTYGTNGFYLPFTDNSALTSGSNAGLGKDFSGNGNYWNTNNISITSGSTYDSMTDVPTLTSATAANFCVINPLDKNVSNVTISNANLTMTTSSTNYGVRASMYVSTGKFYWEATVGAVGTDAVIIGIADSAWTLNYVGSSTGSYGYFSQYGNTYNNGSSAAYGASYTTGDVIGVALDLTNGTLTFYKNGTSQGTAFTGISGTFTPAFSGQTSSVINANFGQRPFAYTPPTGYVALNTYNLPTPTIGATPSSQAGKYFNPVLYTGNGSTQSITGVGFQPDFTWIKCRSYAHKNCLVDAVRGSTKLLVSNDTAAEITVTGVSSFNADGFSVGNGENAINENTFTYVAWNWKANGTGVTNTAGSITSTVSANTTSGFSVVTWTANGTTGATVGHGLGVAPKMIFVKSRDAITGGGDWNVYHASLGATQRVFLNLTSAAQTASQPWNNTAPTSAVFTLGSGTDVNSSGKAMVAYAFSEVAGFSKFGSYTGNGSTDGPFVYTGFRPKYVMYKDATNAGSNWVVIDTSTSPINVSQNLLRPNLSNAELSASIMDIVSNGFKIRTSGAGDNTSGANMIYMAFAENPFKYSIAR